MACSLESRVPILDRRIVDFAFSLPTAIKMRQGRTKAIMRQAFGDLLAPAIRDRRDKIGFPVPVNRWFSGPLREFVGDILGAEQARTRGIFSPEVFDAMIDTPGADGSRALWGMLNIELWFRNFVDCRSLVDKEIDMSLDKKIYRSETATHEPGHGRDSGRKGVANACAGSDY